LNAKRVNIINVFKLIKCGDNEKSSLEKALAVKPAWQQIFKKQKRKRKNV
jgi:hypothetical protein